MSKELVSIVMRTKDRAVLLRRAIKDCIGQTHREFELIIVNDGGDPAPVDQLVDEYSTELDGRCRVIHNPESLGMEAASNAAIQSANGSFICIHDDDDTWDPAFLASCTQYLAENPDDGAVAVRTHIIHEKITDDGVVELSREVAWPSIHQFSLSRLMESNIAVPISCMYRAEVIDKLGGFRDDLPVVGDWEFHIRLAASYDVGFLDGKPLAYWHQRPTQGGVLGNSIFAGADKHEYFDLKIRDEYLKEYAEKNGIGALLWQAAWFKHISGQQVTAFGWTKERVKRILHARKK